MSDTLIVLRDILLNILLFYLGVFSFVIGVIFFWPLALISWHYWMG